MRLLFVILFFILANAASATSYYVKNGGSDAADGLTSATAWATIAKVNATATSGDSVFFNRGDSWTEKIIPSSSNIYYGAYGSGVKPLITAFVSVTGMTDSSGVWSKVLTSSSPSLNTVYINGALRGMARFPNTGYSTATASTDTTITTSLTGTPNYTGSKVAIRAAHWIIDVTNIASQSSGVLKLQQPFSRSGGYLSANGYFLMNNPSFLDVETEWTFDSTTRNLRIKAVSEPTVKVATIDTLVFISKKNYITFENIKFEGANKTGFQIDTSYTVTVKNCTFKDMGGAAISGMKNSKFTLQNDSLVNLLDNGISFFPNTAGQYVPTSPETRLSDSCLFDNNYFKNIGFIAGMGARSNVHYEGLMSIGNDCIITNNRFDSTGYSSIYFNGKRSIIKYNYVTNYCFVKDDGAAVQTGLGGLISDSGSIVRKNIIINGIGNDNGVTDVLYAAGVYIDQSNTGVLIDSNTISKAHHAAMNFHMNDSCTILNNTVLNSDGDVFSVFPESTATLHFTFENNIGYETNSLFYNFYKQSSNSSFGTLDYNYYPVPASATNFKLNSTTYSLAGWRSVTGQESNSRGTPSGATADAPLFYYNPTNTDSTIVLSGNYIDAKSVPYSNAITLQPFSSTLLFKANGTAIFNTMYPNGMFGKPMILDTSKVTPANPTATIGTSAVNGSEVTYMRSDAAPAINQGMSPTWTNTHTFSAAQAIVNTTYNSTGFNARFGTLGIQSNAINSGWVSDNIYYNAGWKYLATGSGQLLAFLDKELQCRIFTNGTAGGTATYKTPFKVNYNGYVGIGGDISGSAAVFSGAKVIVDANMTLTSGNIGVTSGNVNVPAGSVNIGTSTAASGSVLTLSGSAGLQESIQSFGDINGQRGGITFDKYGGTSTTPTAITNGTSIGFLGFRPYDGSALQLPALIEAFVDGTVSSGSVPTRLSFVTGANGATRAERLSVASNGNVGVNQTAATSLFQVNGSFATAIVSKSADYTATISDNTIDCTGGGTFTITLPTAASITGREYTITNSGTGTITIATTSSQPFTNLTGTPTSTTIVSYGSITAKANAAGTGWVIKNKQTY